MSAVEETHLVCLPFAGAGASFFTPWQDRAPEGPHVLPVRLPGREQRFVEEPHTDAVRAAAEAHTQVTRQLPEGARVAVFGHSLGAVLGFELAHRLEAEPGVRLDALVVSGAPGPWSGRADRASGLPDAEFLARVRTFAGYAHPALEHPEMRELLLPLLRADVRMHETYRPASDGPLDAYVVADGDIGDVRRRAARLLPDHMLPATVTAVAALPLTPNGKLDRDRLPAPEPAKPVAMPVSPGDLVTALTGVWGRSSVSPSARTTTSSSSAGTPSTRSSSAPPCASGACPRCPCGCSTRIRRSVPCGGPWETNEGPSPW